MEITKQQILPYLSGDSSSVHQLNNSSSQHYYLMLLMFRILASCFVLKDEINKASGSGEIERAD